jgi:REP element-mobilizing transposase RayT
MVLMPDHFHAIVAFPPYEEISRVIRDWKIYTSRETRVKWQRSFFDHRLRGDESLDQKATYILENPVRARLVGSADDWPFRIGSMLGNR